MVEHLLNGLSDQFHLVGPLVYFSFQPMLHNWCYKGCGMYYPVRGRCIYIYIYIYDPLLLIRIVAHKVAATGFLSHYLTGPLI